MRRWAPDYRTRIAGTRCSPKALLDLSLSRGKLSNKNRADTSHADMTLSHDSVATDGNLLPRIPQDPKSLLNAWLRLP